MVKPKPDTRRRIAGYEIEDNKTRITVAFRRSYSDRKGRTQFEWHKYFDPTPSSIRRLLRAVEQRIEANHE